MIAPSRPQLRVVRNVQAHPKVRMGLIESDLFHLVAELKDLMGGPLEASARAILSDVVLALDGSFEAVRSVRMYMRDPLSEADAAGCTHNIGSTGDACPSCRGLLTDRSAAGVRHG